MMEIKRIDCNFSVCKLNTLPEVNSNSTFFFLEKTDEEISLICPTEDVPLHVMEKEDGWKAFRIQGTLDFSLIGILSKIATLLAESSISIFAISTFNTDYILTKSEQYEKALTLLEKNGYQIV